MNKKIIVYFLIFIILTIALTGCSKNNNQIYEEKINNELSYLDKKLVQILNKVNGISFENYVIKSEQISSSSEDEASTGNSKKEDTSSSKEGQSEGGGNSSESSSSSGEANGSSSNKSGVKYNLIGNEILLQNKIPDWQSAKSEIEKTYNIWYTIMLDLYKINVNNQDILNFNTDLDIAIRSN